MSKVKPFEKDYYMDRLKKGIDYNFYGDWQKNYAKMLIAISDIVEAASNYKDSLFVDLGTACGVTLRGVKELSVFGKVVGLDVSNYMIDIGKQAHKFTDNEMVVCDITKEFWPIEDGSALMVHCAHTLEHIDEQHIKHIFDEMDRILADDGVGILIIPTYKPGVPKSDFVTGDNTHINIQSDKWWRSRIAKHFKIDNEIRNNFRECQFSVGMGENIPTFYEAYNKGWTLFGIRKKG